MKTNKIFSPSMVPSMGPCLSMEDLVEGWVTQTITSRGWVRVGDPNRRKEVGKTVSMRVYVKSTLCFSVSIGYIYE